MGNTSYCSLKNAAEVTRMMDSKQFQKLSVLLASEYQFIKLKEARVLFPRQLGGGKTNKQIQTNQSLLLSPLVNSSISY